MTNAKVNEHNMSYREFLLSITISSAALRKHVWHFDITCDRSTIGLLREQARVEFSVPKALAAAAQNKHDKSFVWSPHVSLR